MNPMDVASKNQSWIQGICPEARSVIDSVESPKLLSCTLRAMSWKRGAHPWKKCTFLVVTAVLLYLVVAVVTTVLVVIVVFSYQATVFGDSTEC